MFGKRESHFQSSFATAPIGWGDVGNSYVMLPYMRWNIETLALVLGPQTVVYIFFLVYLFETVLRYVAFSWNLFAYTIYLYGANQDKNTYIFILFVLKFSWNLYLHTFCPGSRPKVGCLFGMRTSDSDYYIFVTVIFCATDACNLTDVYDPHYRCYIVSCSIKRRQDIPQGKRFKTNEAVQCI